MYRKIEVQERWTIWDIEIGTEGEKSVVSDEIFDDLFNLLEYTVPDEWEWSSSLLTPYSYLVGKSWEDKYRNETVREYLFIQPVSGRGLLPVEIELINLWLSNWPRFEDYLWNEEAKEIWKFYSGIPEEKE